MSRHLPLRLSAILAAAFATAGVPRIAEAQAGFPFFRQGQTQQQPSHPEPSHPDYIQVGQGVHGGQGVHSGLGRGSGGQAVNRLPANAQPYPIYPGQVRHMGPVTSSPAYPAGVQQTTTSPAAPGAMPSMPGNLANHASMPAGPSMTTHGFTVQPNQFAAQPRPMSRTTMQPMGNSPRPGASVELARQYEQRGDFAAADAQYRMLLSQSPQDRSLLISYGRMKHRANDLPGAIQVYQQSLQLFPNDPVILNDLGLCFARMNDLPNAVATLRASVGVRPDSQRYRNNLAIVLLEMNRVEEAHAVLAEVHGDLLAKYNLAVMLDRRGKAQEASQLLASIIESNPSFAPAKALLARIDAPVEQVASLPGAAVGDVITETEAPAMPPAPDQPLSLIEPQSAELEEGTIYGAGPAVHEQSTQAAPDVDAYPIPGVGLAR